ncbi:hypothetical protein TWF506_007163 [Arthrobotrys conoides]|uniref:F-box domain-containing protein n=1 Tax=Arthrobotrys conoides TaxID=74498 RepID=A0AAN8NJT5_9PEZI
MRSISYLLQLPDELLIQILLTGDFKRKHFVILSRVCHRLHRLAGSYLYREKTLVSNLNLKHVEFHCLAPARGVGVRDDISKLLDEEMVDNEYARIETLGFVYTGSKKSFENGEVDVAERMGAVRRAVGRSMGSVLEFRIFVTNRLGRPPFEVFGDRWVVRGVWEMERVRKMEVVVDCWPWWEMGGVDLRGGWWRSWVLGRRGEKWGGFKM